MRRHSRNNLDVRASRAMALPIREILVPTDFSEHSNYALRYALALAGQIGARITLLHVLESPVIAPDEFYPGPVAPNILRAEQAIARTWETEKSKHPSQHQSIVKEGVPSQMIIETATAKGSDLIVIATHGRSGLAHVVLGSTTEKVIRQAPCPVLVVRFPGGHLVKE